MQPIRLGVIGLGLIWIRVHKKILLSMGDAFELVAFCDVDEQRRNETKREFPNGIVLDNYQELLALPELDAVLILTPIALNAPVARAALEAGKHVIMEKPIARSVAEGRELVATAKQANRFLFITEQNAYRQAETILAETIADGEIGDLVVWERVTHFKGETGPVELRFENTAWRKEADFPLGTMFDGGIHLIASLTKTFGVPETVAATGQNLRPEYGDYDQITALFQYAGDVSGMLSFSNYLPQLNNHFYVYGTAGMMIVEERRVVLKKLDQPDRVVDLAGEQAQTSMWHALAQAFQEQREPFYTAEKALNDVAILEAISQAIKSRERVAVEVL